MRAGGVSPYRTRHAGHITTGSRPSWRRTSKPRHLRPDRQTPQRRPLRSTSIRSSLLKGIPPDDRESDLTSPPSNCRQPHEFNRSKAVGRYSPTTRSPKPCGCSEPQTITTQPAQSAGLVCRGEILMPAEERDRVASAHVRQALRSSARPTASGAWPRAARFRSANAFVVRCGGRSCKCPPYAFDPGIDTRSSRCPLRPRPRDSGCLPICASPRLVQSVVVRRPIAARTQPFM
jgi:hypothetical protein